jgi:hypothetical protein
MATERAKAAEKKERQESERRGIAVSRLKQDARRLEWWK